MKGVFENHPFAHQNYDEIMWLLEKVRLRGVKSILEIGSAHGHTLTLLALAAGEGAKICSIDQGLFAADLDKALAELSASGYDVHSVRADSTSKEAKAFAEEHGPFDFIFIDGDHSYSGVVNDWLGYEHLSHCVGFHDIAHADHEGKDFWGMLKQHHQTDEKVVSGMGIGVIYK